MKKLLKYPLLLLAALSAVSVYAAQKKYTIASPDGRLEAAIYVGNDITYTISRQGTLLLERSRIALELPGRTLGENPKLSGRSTKRIDEHIVSPHYRFSSFDASCNELELKFRDGYSVVFRAYDDGVAYRFRTSMKGEIVINNEVAEMNFPQDYTSYMAYSSVKRGSDMFAMAFQNLYTKAPVTGVDTENIAFLPVTFDCGGGVKLTLLESDLESYPGMFVGGDGKSVSLQGVFAKYPKRMDSRPPRAMKYVSEREDFIAKTEGTRSFPWRIWAVTVDDTQMPVNNLVYALASPNRIGDTSWIKTGKVAWDWWNDWGIYGVDFEAGINMQTYKHYIDFASENGIEFVILDEGWYDPGNGDMLTVIPELDLPELIAYGKARNVDLILWTVFNVLDHQLEVACRKYSAMGISGFKVDFLDRDDQTAMEMTYRIAEATARYKLSLDLHGYCKPTGLNRTFPHIINFEGVFGMEEVKWSKVEKDMMEYDVTMPYIRMMAGPVDYTPGTMRNTTKRDFKDVYHNPVSQGTRCHQLAAYVVHDSPLTMLCDNPTVYRKEQECVDFIVSIPNTDIEETRILQGVMGESIVTARRKGGDWYVGGMTDWTPRDITIDFGFLEAGEYEVTLFSDGVNAHRQAADYKKEIFIVTSASLKKIHMAPGGGFAMTVKKH